MNRRTKGVLSPWVHIFTLSCQISWTNTTAASPPLRDTRGYLRELTSRRVFPGCSGWSKNVSFFLFYMLLVDFLLCEVCVFFHCKQHSTDMFLTASGDERGWFLNTKPKRFFSFHPGHAWKESRKLACGILQGSDQLKKHSWRQKRGTPTDWRAIILTCKWSILMQERKQHILPAEHTNADSHIQSRVIQLHASFTQPLDLNQGCTCLLLQLGPDAPTLWVL